MSSDIQITTSRDDGICDEPCDAIHTEVVAAARRRIPEANVLSRAVDIAALLANPTRFRILTALAPATGEPDPTLCVCDLAAVVAASETHASHQLRVLRLAGLVAQRRQGRLVYYRVADDAVVRATVAALASR